MQAYIYQQEDWPHFVWDERALTGMLTDVRFRQGRLLGYMDALGLGLRDEARLETHTINIIKTSEIEGEILNPDQVRSSIARHLGLDIAGLVPSDRHVDGVVEMMLDATQNYSTPLTDERLFGWHAALFPTGRSGLYKITAGQWRTDTTGPMQVVSGRYGKEKVHYAAPAAHLLKEEMALFLNWFNTHANEEPIIKAAIAHFWFVTLHPFEDGNGRIARAIADMQLAMADGSPQRFYSMSAQIQKERNDYYNILEAPQKGTMDITPWLAWFLGCLGRALEATDAVLSKVLYKAKVWEGLTGAALNERQKLMLNKLLEGFAGKLTAAKWAKITKCAHDTALRDIQSLIDKDVLVKDAGGGRSVAYSLRQV